MSTPRCPNPQCQGSSFESQVVSVSGSRHPYSMVHCTRCGAIVTGTDYGSLKHLDDQIGALKKELAELKKRLSV